MRDLVINEILDWDMFETVEELETLCNEDLLNRLIIHVVEATQDRFIMHSKLPKE